MLIPKNENTTISQIEKYHEKQNNKPIQRYHLGVSILGHKCEKYLWLNFRWAVKEDFEGRILRLFRRGNNEEATIVSDLRAIGVDIRNTTSSQSRVDFGKHVSGSLDGIIESGLPEAPMTRHVAEFKTHSKKSFDELVKKGLKESKPMHWTQLNTYMFGKNIDRGFYLGICKDNDEIYTERIELDKPAAKKAVERAQRITMLDRMPEPMSADPTWFECKYCPAHKMCHETKLTTQSNCRTCAHSTAKEDSTWFCERWESDIPYDAQYAGCDSHTLHPNMVPYERKESDKDFHAIYIIDGKPVLNGEDGYLSSEIISNPIACANPDKFMDEVRAEGGRVTG
jgi:hypothetical protein